MMNDNPAPEYLDKLANQIIELEQKLSFQQQAYDDLNAVVLDHQANQERLSRELKKLRELVQGIIDQGTGEALPHEKPPHY